MVRRFNAKSEPIPDMDAASKEKLRAVFEEEQLRLASLLGREGQIWTR